MKSIDLLKFQNMDITLVEKEGKNLEKLGIEGKINAHKLYTACIENIPKEYSKGFAYMRGLMRFKIWNIEKFFGWNEKYFSQAGQDKFIYDNFFKNKKNGYFIEIGAFDGIQGSNCLFFEKFKNWTRLAIEPSPTQFKKLKNNRKCKLINKAASSSSGKMTFIEVNTSESNSQLSGLEKHFSNKSKDILKKNNLKKYAVEVLSFEEILKNADQDIIDYCSIDIEGAEIPLIENFNFSNYKIKVLSIENNWSKTIKYDKILNKHGYSFFDSVGVDEIWVNNSF